MLLSFMHLIAILHWQVAYLVREGSALLCPRAMILAAAVVFGIAVAVVAGLQSMSGRHLNEVTGLKHETCSPHVSTV